MARADLMRTERVLSPARLARCSPASFATVATAEDAHPYRPAKHHLALDRALVDLEQRRSRILIVQMAVQHGKSELASRWFPAWYLGLHPDDYVIECAYNTEFAEDRLGKQARFYVDRFGKSYFGVDVDPTSNARGRWNILNRRGQLVALGVQAGVTGRTGNLVIVDDPYGTAAEAYSKTHRDKSWDWWQYELATRLAPDAIQVHIQSRWSEDDHLGRLQRECDEQGIPYTLIDFPALAICAHCGDYGVETVNQCGHGLRDSLGRLPGEALWPEVRPRDFLLEQRKRVGPRAFDALFQGRPRPDSGSIFKREWFCYADRVADSVCLYDNSGNVAGRYALAACRVFQIVDLAAGTSRDTGDYTAIGTFALCPGNELVVLDMFHERIDGTQQLPTLWQLWQKHRAGRIGVEAVAYQWTFVQQAIAQGLPVVPITRARGDGKETRAYVIAARYETGQVFHLRNAPWVDSLEQELLDFPSGAHDDQVDVMSDAGAVVAEAMSRCGAIMVRGVKI